MSLPSCIPQDQEFVTGHTTGCKIPLLNNRNHPERNDHERQRPNFLPLSPVNTAYVSVNALEPAKGERVFIYESAHSKQLRDVERYWKFRSIVKQQMIEQRPKLTEKRKCHAEMVSIMSTLYANLLIVVGLAVPITANVTERVPASLNQVLSFLINIL